MAQEEKVSGGENLAAIRKIAERFAPVFSRYGIQKAILFGSVARGEATRRSDIDLILIQQTTKRFLDRYDGILCDLNRESPGPAVDVLIYTPGEFDRMGNRGFIAKAVREGRVLYEQQRDEEPGAAMVVNGDRRSGVGQDPA
jgi:predicted nucleotidyltransferase